MKTTIDAMKQALEADRAALIAELREFIAVLESSGATRTIGMARKAADMLAADAQKIASLSTCWEQERNVSDALAQQVAVPQVFGGSKAREQMLNAATAPQPPQAERVPMTDGEIDGILRTVYAAGNHGRSLEHAFARAIEAHHKIGVK